MPITISTSPAIFPWQPATWLRVTGADAATFLQGQFTNDLRALPASGAAVYGLWLSLKGKVMADSFVLHAESGDAFWIGSYFSPAAVIRERLEHHVIADDVTIEDETAQWRAVSLLGRKNGAAWPTPRADAGEIAFRGRRTREENVEWVYRVAGGEPAWLTDARADPVVKTLEAEEMSRLRIRAGIPAIPQDIGPADLPNEAGLDREAISYTKGCYLGQEVMARLKSMGQVRRRLLRVAGLGETMPAVPAPLFAGARRVGELRSAVRDEARGWIGLAIISLLQVSAGAELALAAEGAPALRLIDQP